MDVGVAYKEDTDAVVDIFRDIGTDIQSDKDFADSAVAIKIRIKTRPLKQWIVGRELRRRIKKAFDSEGIEIPFPHSSLYMGEVLNPFLTRPMTASEEVALATKRAQQATAKQTRRAAVERRVHVTRVTPKASVTSVRAFCDLT